jgi:CheY-like chemotaxis protein/CHASE3 domain sensor protein/putative methionine-R-sulfoxide reductase with GAF domain
LHSTADLPMEHRQRAIGLPLPPGPFMGFLVAAAAVLVIALFTDRAFRSREDSGEQVHHAMEVLERTKGILRLLAEAESAQRGYLLTGDNVYLAPYNDALAALPREMQSLRTLMGDREDLIRRMDVLEELIGQKTGEMAQTIELGQGGKGREALAVIRTDVGQQVMERIRQLFDELEDSERAALMQRQEEWRRATNLTLALSWGGAVLLLVLILAAALTTSRDFLARESESRLRAAQSEFAARLQGEQRLQELGSRVLTFLAEHLDAQVGAVYVFERHDALRRIAGYAIAPEQAADTLRPGDGLLGQAAQENRVIHVRDVPEGYLRVASSLGSSNPREIIVAPATTDGVVQAVVELGFFRTVQPSDMELLRRVSEVLAVAVRASKDRTRLEDLLTQTQRQAEELQTQQEELRVSNEELEVQTRALKETQLRLQNQQAQLEQTNLQLEERTRELEQQKSELARAQAVLAQKAAELERTNQYKSEFLANMSHELRTPLNSTLILAKLLADNRTGNLTEEQVKFAQTISSAGKELLGLINDILDLSRIEAGKMELSTEQISVAKCVESVMEGFVAQAKEKGLTLTHTIHPETPEHIETDAKRLGQILRNLLSNALKFTERGGVSLDVSPAPGDRIAFAVRDTGIGIPAHLQDLVFEAFRQADGSTHRRYGGSGLGLAISRDLARLLGGDVTLQSEPDKGSTFTLVLPRAFRPPAPAAPETTAELPVLSPAPAPVNAPPSVAPVEPVEIADDREALNSDSRIILVVEDDPPFAAILRDLAHEMGFKCVVTHTARDALLAAREYQPSAILLDIHLPDRSGLAVLDQLKRDPQTRHIPVHCVSAADHSQEALELGAVGYLVKPVKREELVEAFRRLEAKLSQNLRRVLVVEDDTHEQVSIERLLASDDVRVTLAGTAKEALEQLHRNTFDCMVLDLTLPDLSGIELLEKMSEEDGLAFPPVIVHTARTLTRDEEEQLRRFSRSIIIKDARSPERLLDEVTLFLHQVESRLPPERQRMLQAARDRETVFDGRRVLIVEDDTRNIYALSSLLEPRGVHLQVARNGRDALEVLERTMSSPDSAIDLVLMDIMMPEMDGITAMQEIRKRPEWSRLPIVALTAKARKDDQEKCLAAGANDYIAKPLDVDRLLSLMRVWMPR